MNEPLSVHADDARGRPWGFWATSGFGLIVIAAFLVLQLIGALPFIFAQLQQSPQLDAEALTEIIEKDGRCATVATFLSAAGCIALTILFARLRRGCAVRDYLALRAPQVRTALVWILAMAGFIVCSDLLTYATGRPIVHPWMIDVYRTGWFLPLVLAIVVVGPLFEEIFFRGFVLAGYRRSPVGAVGAVGLTSIGWAALHVQYEAYGLATIGALGILLGVARLKSGSTIITLLMHAFSNLVAMIELLVVVHFFS